MSQSEINFLVPSIDRSGPVTLVSNYVVALSRLCSSKTIKLFYLKNRDKSILYPDKITIKRFQLKDFVKCKDNLISICYLPDLVNFLLMMTNCCRTNKLKGITIVSSFDYFNLRFKFGKFKAKILFFIWIKLSQLLSNRVVLNHTMKRFYNRYDKHGIYDVIFHSLPNHLELKFKPKRESTTIKVIFVGSLDDRKNILALCNHVIKSSLYELTILGDGKYKIPILEFAKKNSKTIRYEGFQNDPQQLIQNHDVLALPSFSEGLPTVCLEAYYNGTPCIMSNIAVHRELAKLGFGVVFNHKTFKDFDTAVISLTENNQARNDKSPNKKFDHNINSKQLLALINEQ